MVYKFLASKTCEDIAYTIFEFVSDNSMEIFYHKSKVLNDIKKYTEILCGCCKRNYIKHDLTYDGFENHDINNFGELCTKHWFCVECLMDYPERQKCTQCCKTIYRFCHDCKLMHKLRCKVCGDDISPIIIYEDES